MESNYLQPCSHLSLLWWIPFLLMNGITNSTSEETKDLVVNQPVPIDLFIFAGQSNIAGADAVITDAFEFTEAEKRTQYTGAPLPLANQSPFYTPWGSVRGHPSGRMGHPGQMIIGPEVGFARQLQKAGMSQIAIISAWANYPKEVKTWPWAEGEYLNLAWMKFVDERLDELRKNHFLPVIRGFVWHQGIDDGIHGSLSDKHLENVKALIQYLRTRFRAPQVPFVLARSVNSPIARQITGDGPDSPMAKVRAAQVAVGDTLPLVGWVNVDDLPNVNQHHFSAESQIIIGGRFAEKFLSLTQAKDSPGKD